MKECYPCNGKLKKEHVNIARYWGKELIALQDVPALVCQQCGERYFEAKISAEIDKKIKQGLERKKTDNLIPTITVPVMQF